MSEVAWRWSRLAEALRKAVLGIADGFAAAHRYRRLAAMSDAALARAGLTRQDLPWVMVSGERAPRPASSGGARSEHRAPRPETSRQSAGAPPRAPAAAHGPAS